MGIAPAGLLQPDQAGLDMDWNTVGPLLRPENRLLNGYNRSKSRLQSGTTCALSTQDNI